MLAIYVVFSLKNKSFFKKVTVDLIFKKRKKKWRTYYLHKFIIKVMWGGGKGREGEGRAGQGRVGREIQQLL